MYGLKFIVIDRTRIVSICRAVNALDQDQIAHTNICIRVVRLALTQSSGTCGKKTLLCLLATAHNMHLLSPS